MTVTVTNDVGDLLRKGNEVFGNLESASLRLNKFVCFEKNNKGAEISAVCKLINSSVLRSKSLQWQLPDAVSNGGRTIILKLESRLAIHLGGGILENSGMCIHPHFNCPWLPGSGVKGVARHAAWCCWKESNDIQDAMNLAWVFGYPTGDRNLDKFLNDAGWEYKAWAGMIAFLPAFPVSQDFKAVVDIVTPHHTDYYSDKKNSRQDFFDTEKPTPSPFPTIEKGSAFKFVIRPLENRVMPTNAISIDDALTLAEKFIVDGMTIYGAGAKTAAGYGWFSKDEELTKRINDDIALQKKAEAEIREKEKKEKERLASLSPEERMVEDYIKSLGDGDVTAVIKGKMAKISDLDDAEQRCICILLRDHERFLKIWKKDIKEAAKVADQDEKKKAKNKGYKRVIAVRSVAERLGVILP